MEDQQKQDVKDDKRPAGDKPNGKLDGKQNHDTAEGLPAEVKKKRIRTVAIVVVATLIVLGAAFYWWHSQHFEDTDDAQVDAYITNVAPRVAGTVIAVHVEDNQQVKKDDVLVELDPRDLRVARDQAKAALDQADAQLRSDATGVPITEVTNTTTIKTSDTSVSGTAASIGQLRSQLEQAIAQNDLAQRDLIRAKNLLATQAISQAEYDQRDSTARAAAANTEAIKHSIAEQQSNYAAAAARQKEAQENAPKQLAARQAQVDISKAKVESAKADLEQAELNLSYATIVAPVNGIVGRRSVNVGDRVAVAQALLALTQTDEIWVTANFRETQLRIMQVGQKVTIHVDTVGKDFSGTIESIGAATGSRYSVLPPENATGNYVKVVQRLPVRIKLDDGQDGLDKLRPGMSVEPKVTVK